MGKNKRSLTLHLLTNDSVQQVKQQILHLNERYLSNEHNLSHYDILDNATIHLMQGPIPKKPSDEMVIFIEIETIKTLTLTVTQNQTVQSVKEMIFEKESFEVHRQYLVFNEKEMENEHDLNHYHIENNSKLSLFLTVLQKEYTKSENIKDNRNIFLKKSHRNNKKRRNKNKSNKKQNKFKNKKGKNRKNNKQQQTEVQKCKKSKKPFKESAVSGFERMDFGLNLYYEQMGKKDYRNEYGVGKFIEWAE